VEVVAFGSNIAQPLSTTMEDLRVDGKRDRASGGTTTHAAGYWYTPSTFVVSAAISIA